MALTHEPRIDTRPCPGDANDCLFVTLDDELARQGYAPMRCQTRAKDLEAVAAGVLWDNKDVLELVARLAIDQGRDWLVREG